MIPLHWPLGYPPTAPSAPPSWLERLFPPYRNYTQVKQALDEQLQSRPRPDPSVWGDDPLRIKVGLLVCRRLMEEYEWLNDHFIPNDPFDIVFLIPWDDLQIVEVIMGFEEGLGIEITNEEAEAWSGRTLGDVVDTLLAKCKTSSVM